MSTDAGMPPNVDLEQVKLMNQWVEVSRFHPESVAVSTESHSKLLRISYPSDVSVEQLSSIFRKRMKGFVDLRIRESTNRGPSSHKKALVEFVNAQCVLESLEFLGNHPELRIRGQLYAESSQAPVIEPVTEVESLAEFLNSLNESDQILRFRVPGPYEKEVIDVLVQIPRFKKHFSKPSTAGDERKFYAVFSDSGKLDDAKKMLTEAFPDWRFHFRCTLAAVSYNQGEVSELKNEVSVHQKNKEEMDAVRVRACREIQRKKDPDNDESKLLEYLHEDWNLIGQQSSYFLPFIFDDDPKISNPESEDEDIDLDTKHFGADMRLEQTELLNQSCSLCGQSAKFLCSRCQQCCYCSQQCQRHHWTTAHHSACRSPVEDVVPEEHADNDH